MPSDDRRGLANCFFPFRDPEKIGRLESWLTEENDFLAGFAFSALASINPDRAFERLKDVPIVLLSLMRGHWLLELLRRKPAQTRQALREWIEYSSLESFWDVARLYEGRENDIDGATVDLMLTKLEQIIDAQIPWRWRLLRLLASGRAVLQQQPRFDREYPPVFGFQLLTPP